MAIRALTTATVTVLTTKVWTIVSGRGLLYVKGVIGLRHTAKSRRKDPITTMRVEGPRSPLAISTTFLPNVTKSSVKTGWDETPRSCSRSRPLRIAATQPQGTLSTLIVLPLRPAPRLVRKLIAHWISIGPFKRIVVGLGSNRPKKHL